MEKARTHDISSIDYHIKDLKTFGQTLTKAAAAAFPVSGASRYSEVHVLLLSWENDNLGVIKELNELGEVFRSTYKYIIETWRIPSHRAHTSLGKRITKFVDDYESNGSLLIVYYGGHGHMNDDRQCVWSCDGTPNSAEAQWFGLQTMLEQAESDVLILLDCCAAASSASQTGSGVNEVLAACGFETWAPGVCEHSFTRSLIEELKYWSQGSAISVAMLHNKILSRIKYWKPRYGLPDCGMTGHPELRKTPIYTVIGNEGNQRSIELVPMEMTNLPAELPRDGQPDVETDVLMTSVEISDETRLECSLDSLAKVWPDPNFECPKVLIALSLEKEQWLRTDAWAEWLKKVPGIVNYAHVEGVYETYSKLVLCSIPVAVWDLLPSDPAVQFIAFVNSSNLLASECTTAVETQTASIGAKMHNWASSEEGKQPLWYENQGNESLAPEDPPVLRSSGEVITSHAISSPEEFKSAFAWLCHHCLHLNNPKLSPELCGMCPHKRCRSCQTERTKQDFQSKQALDIAS